MSRGTGWGIGIGLGALALAAQLAGSGRSHADVTVDEGGTILVYPKVINAGGRDTIIQLSNAGNTLMHLHCFYTDARPFNPSQPVSPQNPRLWQETDFFLWLTRQQPTAWAVSEGRALNPLQGTGFDPGSIPGVSPGFTGELMCIEVDSAGNPIGANRLKGEATLVSASGDASTYSAIAIQSAALAGENGRTLELDNEHYNSCPATLILNHFASGAVDPVVGPPDDFGDCTNGCPITTELTLVPCGHDFENQIPGKSQVSIAIINEFEERFSASRAVDCWSNESLNRISGAMTAPVLGSLTAQSRLTPVATTGGVLGVAEETHTNDGGVLSRAAWNLQTEGSFYEPGAQRTVIDKIVIPGEF
jgi:hypothetical protein